MNSKHKRQPDLFTSVVAKIDSRSAIEDQKKPIILDELSDEMLISALSGGSINDTLALVAEAGRRRLTKAIPALEKLCRSFAGFGADVLIKEQAAALHALSLIGGDDAAHAVTIMISKRIVQGPTLGIALKTAAKLHAKLSSNTLRTFLQHDDPCVRTEACRCVLRHNDLAAILIDLLGDLNIEVRNSSACALGRLGRQEARPILQALLTSMLTTEVIKATPMIADDNTCVLLGRIARTRPEFAGDVKESLEAISSPRAERILAGLR